MAAANATSISEVADVTGSDVIPESEKKPGPDVISESEKEPGSDVISESEKTPGSEAIPESEKKPGAIDAASSTKSGSMQSASHGGVETSAVSFSGEESNGDPPRHDGGISESEKEPGSDVISESEKKSGPEVISESEKKPRGTDTASSTNSGSMQSASHGGVETSAVSFSGKESDGDPPHQDGVSSTVFLSVALLVVAAVVAVAHCRRKRLEQKPKRYRDQEAELHGGDKGDGIELLAQMS